MSYLEIVELEYKAGSFDLKVSLSLKKGETGILLGPSGCGKTSLLRCIAGLEHPQSGTVRIQDRAMTSIPPDRRNFGYVFQDLALFDHLTGRGNMEFGLKLRGWDRSAIDRRIAELASKLRIEGLLDRRPLAMSGGERQRLAFARSLAFFPDLLLLDEPLSSLDAPLRRELRAFLGESLRREEVTALHVTHDVEEALELADVIFLMRSGRIVARGSPRELYSSPPDAWTVTFLGLGSLFPVHKISMSGSILIAETALGPVRIPDPADGHFMQERGPVPPSLFVPAKAVSFGQGVGGALRFKAKVQRIVYTGGAIKVSVSPLHAATFPLPGKEPASLEESIEFEASPSLKFSQDEEIVLSLDPEECRLVSGDCKG